MKVSVLSLKASWANSGGAKLPAIKTSKPMSKQRVLSVILSPIDLIETYYNFPPCSIAIGQAVFSLSAGYIAASALWCSKTGT
jgi:hypothetical protein